MMLSFHEKLQQIRGGHQGRREQGAALIFAVIVVMVMLLTVTLVTTSAITAISSTTDQSVTQLKRQAAETGIQSALMAANGETSTPTQSIFERSYSSGGWYHGDLRNVVTGEPAVDARYRWRAEPVVEYGGRLSWYIFSQGYISGEDPETEGQHIQSLFRGLEVESGGTTAAGSTGITYNATRQNPWQVSPMFGETRLSISPGVTIRSYDSYNGFNPQLQADRRALLGTNGEIAFLSNAPLPEGITEFSVPEFVSSSCTGGNPCTQAKFTNRGFNYENTAIASALGEACPLSTYSIWQASANGGVLDLSGTAPRCFRELQFDANTTVLGSAPVYVTGAMRVNSGVKVNVGNDPSALRIYSDSGSMIVGNTNSALETATHANFYYATNSGSCQLYGTFSGAVSCLRTGALPNAKVYVDMSAGTKFVERGTSRNVNLWYEVSSQRR